MPVRFEVFCNYTIRREKSFSRDAIGCDYLSQEVEKTKQRKSDIHISFTDGVYRSRLSAAALKADLFR